MNNIDEFIKKMCDGECKEYFESSQERAFSQIKISLPPNMFSQKQFDSELQINIATIASPLIQKNNKIDKNRFWILYYRLSEQLITQKCDKCKNSIDKLMCVEYILDRLISRIKTFNVDAESIPFQEVRYNLAEISKIYNDSDGIELEINPKKLKYTTGVVHNYTQKIIKNYRKDSVDTDVIKVIIDNALLSIEMYSSKTYQKKGEKNYLEKEVLAYLNHDKKELNQLLYPLLIELFHREKFFNYIYNNFINSRFIDFTRTLKKKLFPPDIEEKSLEDELVLNDVLENYLEIIPHETQLILRLKIGERLNNRDFIKRIYLLDYREIDVFKNFTNEEILEIKFYARNNIDLSVNIIKKISKVRKKLQSNSYLNREEDGKRVTLLKLIFSEEMSAREIGLVLDYTEKQIYKKIESIKNKIKKNKELTQCKEM